VYALPVVCLKKFETNWFAVVFIHISFNIHFPSQSLVRGNLYKSKLNSLMIKLPLIKMKDLNFSFIRKKRAFVDNYITFVEIKDAFPCNVY